MSTHEISLLSETVKDEVTKINLTFNEGQFIIETEGQTVKLSHQMSKQLLSFIKSIDESYNDQTINTTLELRIKKSTEH